MKDSIFDTQLVDLLVADVSTVNQFAYAGKSIETNDAKPAYDPPSYTPNCE